jgi:hypothetical protein
MHGFLLNSFGQLQSNIAAALHPDEGFEPPCTRDPLVQ